MPLTNFLHHAFIDPEQTANTEKPEYLNPFKGVAHQYFPYHSMDLMLWWAEHFLMRFGFYRAALSRIANYFITSITFKDVQSSQDREAYEQAFEKLNWKEVLFEAGLNLLATSNLFMTISAGTIRFLKCPSCGDSVAIQAIDNYEFTSNAEFIWTCPKCKYHGKFKVVDITSKKVQDIVIRIWPPREIYIEEEIITKKKNYYWRIPEAYKRKILKENNKFYSKFVPMDVYKAALNNRLLQLDNPNFIHIALPTPAGLYIDGKAIPLCMYLFDEFFQLKMLQRYNESICLEDIDPLRVIRPAIAGQEDNPFAQLSSTHFLQTVSTMIREKRRNPGGYLVSPYPIAVERFGSGMDPQQKISELVVSILNALNVPNEFFTMNLQTQVLGPALRLFENSWSILVSAYNKVLQKIADVIRALLNLDKCKVELTPVTLSDDLERKSIIAQLASANIIANSELLRLYGFSYEDQVKKKLEEQRITQELIEDEQRKQMLEKQDIPITPDQMQAPISPMDVVAQALQIAQQLLPLGPAERRQQLQQIKAQDETLYAMVKAKLEELTRVAESQGKNLIIQQLTAQ